MDLEELRAFLAVAERGSFLAAAVHTSMSRATLRRRVDALESRIGRPLLDRNSQGVTLTEVGELLASQGRVIMQDVGVLVDALRNVSRAPAGRVTVMLPIGLPPHLTPQLVSLLRAQCPDIEVTVRLHNDPAGAALDDVDIAVYASDNDPPGPWIIHEVMVVREHLIASADYIAEHGAPETLEALAEHELYAWSAPDRDPRTAPLWSGGTTPIKPVFLASDIHMLRHIAHAGLGLVLAPDAEIDEPHLDRRELRTILPKLIGRHRSARVAVRGVVAELPKNRAVLERFHALIESLDR